MSYPIYKKNKNLPLVDDPTTAEEHPDLDPDLVKILNGTIEGNSYNNEVCFFLDEMVQSFAKLTISNIKGKGFRVQVPNNKEAEKRITNFNRHINNLNERIDDWMDDVWFDNLMYGFSLYRVGKMQPGPDDELTNSLEILRIPPSTIEIKRDPINGWRKFIQSPTAYMRYNTYKDFLGSLYPNKFEPLVKINIPDDPRTCIFVSFFKRAPMNAVNKYVVLKNWIVWFIRKFAEKTWAPMRIAFVGDPKTPQYPANEDDMEDQLTQTNAILKRLVNFSSASFPGHTRIETSEPKNTGEIYLKYMSAMNESIMYGLYASMSLRDSPGVYKGAQSADEGLIHFMENVRDNMESALKRFYIYNITPELTEDDIVVTWSELRTSNISEIANAFKIGAENIIFKDAKERRRAMASIFPILLDDCTPEEIKEMDELFEQIKSPSQAASSVEEDKEENNVDAKSDSGPPPSD
jgi:hypothetical protein